LVYEFEYSSSTWGGSERRTKVEIISVGPPCLRCEATKLIVDRVVSRLELDDITVSMVDSEKTLGRYGVAALPSLAVNGSSEGWKVFLRRRKWRAFSRRLCKRLVLRSPNSWDEVQG